MSSGPAPRLLLVAYNFPPDFTVGAKRALRIATHLSALGWDVSVLTVASAYYDRLDSTLMNPRTPFRIIRTSSLAPIVWARRLRRVWRRGRAEQTGGAQENGPAPALPTGPPILGSGSIRRAIATPDDFSGWIPPAVIAGWMRVRRPDVVLATGPPFTAHVVAAALARLHGSRLVLDYRDPWNRFPTGNEAPPSARDMTGLERWTTGRAAALTSTTRGISDAQAAWRVSQRRVIPNAVDPVPPGVPGATPPRDPGFTILYAGTFYGTRSARPVLEALARLKKNVGPPGPGIRLSVMGVMSEEVLAKAEELGVRDCVDVFDFQPYAEAMRRMRAADLLLLVVGDTHGGMVPAKLFDYLAAGRPILGIGPAGSEAGEILREAGEGEMLASDDIAGIAAAIAAHTSGPGREPSRVPPERFAARATMSDLDRFLRGLLA